MAERFPSPVTHPRDPSLYANKGFFDWVRRRLSAEIPPLLTATVIGWNPSNIATSPGFTTIAVPVPGALFSISTAHPAAVAVSQTLAAGAFLTAHVSANDVVTVTLFNLTGAALNVSGIAYMRVIVWAFP